MMYTLISSPQTGLQTHCKTNAEKFIHDSITRRKQTSNARVAMTLSNAKFRNNFIALYTRISRRFRVRLFLKGLGGFHKGRPHRQGEGGLAKADTCGQGGEEGFKQCGRVRKLLYC